MGRRGPGARPVKARPIAPQPTATPREEGLSRADAVIAFIEGLLISSGAHANTRMRLRPWQREIIHSIYATDSSGRRPVRTCVISMGRKGGKSALAAALALCHLAGPEATSRGQIVSAAADRGQAAIIYAEMRAFVLRNPELAARIVFREFTKTAEDEVTGSTYAALSADARKAHGLSPTLAICDEVAMWRNAELLDALRTGQGAHAEPLLLAISTRSPDPDNPLEELIRYGQEVRDGITPDPHFASHVWSAPPEADPWAEETWRAANPGLGDIRSIEDVRVLATQARRLPSQEAAFRAFVLNQPVAPDDRFIRPGDWDACAGEPEPAGLCYGGLDLSSGPADLTAFALYWPKSGALRVWAFLPAASLEQKIREDNAPYRAWAEAGHIVVMPGRTIDRVWLSEWMAEQTSTLPLKGIATDRWLLNDLQATLNREGIRLPLKPMGQGFKDFSPALSAFEAEILASRIRHGGSPLLRWAVANAAVDMDPAGNRKLSKARARGRIDPLVAAVEAVGLAQRAGPAPNINLFRVFEFD